MEEQKFHELAAKVNKRWEHAQRLSLLYTVLALLGGSVWLTLAYIKTRQYRTELAAKQVELNLKEEDLAQKEIDLKTASLSIADQQLAQSKEIRQCEEAIQHLLARKPGAQERAQQTLNNLNVRPVSTPIPHPRSTTPFGSQVRAGDKISIKIEPVKTSAYFVIVKDGQTLLPPYSFVVDKKPGQTIFVLMEFSFTPDTSDDAKYKVAITVNDSSLQYFEVLKTAADTSRSLRFLVQ